MVFRDVGPAMRWSQTIACDSPFARSAELAREPVSESFDIVAGHTVRPSISPLHLERQSAVQIHWRDDLATSARIDAQALQLDYLHNFYLDELAVPLGMRQRSARRGASGGRINFLNRGNTFALRCV
jgi:hypothetical protein